MSLFKRINLLVFLLALFGAPALVGLGATQLLGWRIVWILFILLVLMVAIYTSLLSCPKCHVRLARNTMQPWARLVYWHSGSKCWGCKKAF